VCSVVGDGEPACRRGSVPGSLAGVPVGGHPSERPTWGWVLLRGPGRAVRSPVWPCSGWGLPSRPGHPGRWCALTAPFHPYLCPEGPSAVCSLWHFPAGHPDRLLAGTLPSGAPTFLDAVKRRRGHLAGSPSRPVCPNRPVSARSRMDCWTPAKARRATTWRSRSSFRERGARRGLEVQGREVLVPVRGPGHGVLPAVAVERADGLVAVPG